MKGEKEMVFNITLFIFITMLCGNDNIVWNISPFRLIPQNIVRPT